MIQTRIVTICCLNLDDDRLIGADAPNTIEAFSPLPASITSILNFKLQTPSNLIDNVLKYKATILKAVFKTFESVSGQLVRSRFSEVGTKFGCAVRFISYATIARNRKDLADRIRLDALGIRAPNIN